MYWKKNDKNLFRRKFRSCIIDIEPFKIITLKVLYGSENHLIKRPFCKTFYLAKPTHVVQGVLEKKTQKKQQGNQGKHSPMVASKTTAIANFSYSSAGKSISWPRTGSFIQQTYKSHSRTSTSQHASTSTTFIFRKTSKQDVSWNTVKLLRILGQTNHR